jgi:hypothetical protein
VTTIEDRLRAATQAAAETVAPGSAPPLRLPDDSSHGPAGRPRRGGWRRWAGWLTPLAAGAAVTGVIVGTLTISGAIHGPPPPGGGHVNPEQVPPYYVALTFTGNGTCCRPEGPFEPRTSAVVRATATGAVLATIKPPRPYSTFAGVAAAADDRTFVLAAAGREGGIPVRPGARGPHPPAIRFFLLRIDPAGAPASIAAGLTPPPIRAGNDISDFALSPDGTSLAVLDMMGVHVFNLATGAERSWWIPIRGGKYRMGLVGYFGLGTGATNAMLAWQSDRILAFVCYGAPTRAGLDTGRGVRFLDTRALGTNLLADSRLVQPQRAIGTASWRQALPTTDGRRLIDVLQVQGTRAYPQLSLQLAVCSARTGRILRVLNRVRADGPGAHQQVLWASPSGRTLVVIGTRPVRNPPPAPFFMAGARVLSSGHSRPIPWSNRTVAAAW